MLFQSDCFSVAVTLLKTLLDVLHELVRYTYVMALLFLPTNVNSMFAATTIDS